MKILKLFWILLVTLLVSCSHSNKPLKEVNPAFSKYVANFTKGDYLSVGTHFILRFHQPVKDSVKLGQKVDLEIFSFSPSVKGQAIWIDNQTIEFTPDAMLKANTIYEVSISIGKLISVAKQFEVMEYEIKTMEQSVRLGDGLLNTYPDEMRFFRYENELLTADIALPEAIEKVVSANFDNQKFRIKWNHDAAGRIHKFYIDSIPRKKSSQNLSLKIDADAIGAEVIEPKKERIPGINEFEVLSITPLMGENQSITIRFSDPLLRDQNIEGLVSLASGELLNLTQSGNMIIATPVIELMGKKTLIISRAIKNALAFRMKSSKSFDITFESIKPAVRLMGKGNIMPSHSGLIFPFEAVNLRAVDLRIIQVYEENVLFFLQENSFDTENNLMRVGRIVAQKKVNLLNNKIDMSKWNTFKIDLAKIIKIQPGAIYRVEIRFRKEYSLYNCNGNSEETTDITDDEYALEVKQASAPYDDGNFYYGDYDYYDYENYDWQQRENPCHSSYYAYGRNVAKNILVSNIGIVVKGSTTGQYIVAATDIISAKPIAGAKVVFYNFQRQVVGGGSTDADGFFRAIIKQKPYFVVVTNENQKGYLKIGNQDALSLSNFNVDGMVMQDGMKGFIYGERGVWRPGDELFITFILEDKYDQLPEQYPVRFSLYNPANQLIETQTLRYGENGFYHFHTSTASDAITGDWLLKVQAGGALFTRNIKIEAIKPNRLRANIAFNKDIITHNDLQTPFKLTSQWLHGAPAANLDYNLKLKLHKTTTKFKNYGSYNFDDITEDFQYEEKDLGSGKLNEEGLNDLSLDFGVEKAPGLLTATITTRVFEKSGDFSIMTQNITYSHYDKYVGSRLLSKGEGNWYNIKEKQKLGIVVVDAKGRPSANQRVNISIYKVSWRWWWQSYDDLANYMQTSSTSIVKTLLATTTADGKATVDFQLPYANYNDNGRYLIVVEELSGGHRSSFAAYFSEWYGTIGGVGEAATVLAVSSNKNEYKVDEEAEIVIPSSAGGVALVSIEKGDEILDVFRVETKANETRFKFNITPEMAPGIYAHITLLQPHSQTINDNPIRMFGVIPLDVINPQTKLKPNIKMATKLEPEKKFTVNISEATGKAMTYTLAIVDEGLLDITGFTTPNPWPRFYSREALMVRTWDLYDYVIGAYGARLENAISIGGGDKILDPSKSKTQRFKPVVLYSGPHSIGKGENKTHSFTMPNYVGSVRVMVIAGNNGAYGNAEKTIPVKKDLMILSTMPRVLGPGEEVQLPITVFAMNPKVKSVTVTISTNGLLTATKLKTMTVTFTKIGEKVVYFPLKVALTTGKAKLHIEATGAGMKAVNDLEIEVRNPNLPQTVVYEKVLKPGEVWKSPVKTFGIKGTNSSSVEVSSIAPIDLTRRLDYLINYPYGCIEQTVSAAFPQLYLEKITNLSEKQKAEIQANITEALNSLRNFQLPNGAFSYWPGEEIVNNWGTNYAGHFLIEAAQLGYNLPSGMLKSWISYQSSAANQWSYFAYNGSDLEQAYRLFLLAKIQKPESSAMNRLREFDKISYRAKFLLAGAYAVNKQTAVAIKLLSQPAKAQQNMPYEYDYTFGSDFRDDAIKVLTLNVLNKNSEAFLLVKEISENLSSNVWMSTQTTAFCLMAVADFYKIGMKDKMKFQLNIDGKSQTVETNKSMFLNEIKVSDMGNHFVEVKNTSSKICYVKLNVSGTPATMKEPKVNKNLNLEIDYVDMAGNKIDPKKIKQGSDFKAIVTVTNTGFFDYYYNMSLSQIFPSGWEIINNRLFSIGESTGYKVDYQDIRDDRVLSFFGIQQNQSATFSIMLNAAYLGKYYLPAVHCEAMYDNRIEAVMPGEWVEVVK